MHTEHLAADTHGAVDIHPTVVAHTRLLFPVAEHQSSRVLAA